MTRRGAKLPLLYSAVIPGRTNEEAESVSRAPKGVSRRGGRITALNDARPAGQRERLTRRGAALRCSFCNFGHLTNVRGRKEGSCNPLKLAT